MANRLLQFLHRSRDSQAAGATPEPVAAEDDLPARLSRWADELTETAGRHPGLTLGVGLTIGVLLGWLIKRR